MLAPTCIIWRVKRDWMVEMADRLRTEFTVMDSQPRLGHRLIDLIPNIKVRIKSKTLKNKNTSAINFNEVGKRKVFEERRCKEK